MTLRFTAKNACVLRRPTLFIYTVLLFTFHITRTYNTVVFCFRCLLGCSLCWLLGLAGLTLPSPCLATHTDAIMSGILPAGNHPNMPERGKHRVQHLKDTAFSTFSKHTSSAAMMGLCTFMHVERGAPCHSQENHVHFEPGATPSCA